MSTRLLYLLLFLCMALPAPLLPQKISYLTPLDSAWALRFGYEKLFTKFFYQHFYGYFTWTTPERYQLIQLRMTNAHALHLALRYSITSGFHIALAYKFRAIRFFIWPGTFVEEDPSYNHTPGLFYILPLIQWQYGPFIRYDKSHGLTLRTHNFLLSTELSHRLRRSRSARLHYLLAFGFDYTPPPDTPNSISNFYTDNIVFDPLSNQRIKYTLYASFQFSNDSAVSIPQPFFDFAIAYSNKFIRNSRFRFELGIHKIHFNFYPLPYSSYFFDRLYDLHWNVQLQYSEYSYHSNQSLLHKENNFQYPITIAGIYANLSIVLPLHSSN